MEDSEQIPDERAALKHQGEFVAEAWFEAEGQTPILVLRIPRERLDGADATRQLTIALLVEAAAVPHDEIESWRLADIGCAAEIGLSDPLPPPPDATHLTVYVHLKPPAAPEEVPLEKWHAIEACWKAVLGLEASIDTTRLGMDGLRSEMESAFKRTMTVEEKLNALQSDVAQWSKAKTRIHHALPKLREFIHRATWALAVPERKRLEEIYKNYVEPRRFLPQVDQVREQLEHLQKDRQVLVAQGNAVYQECRGILADIQRAVGMLQRNATDNARRKRDAKNQKGKHF